MRSRARSIFVPSARSIRAAHLRLGHRLTLRHFKVQVEKQRPDGQDFANATSPESTPELATGFTGAANNASRTHSARRIPAPRARSCRKANSASLTLLPTDLYGAAAS